LEQDTGLCLDQYSGEVALLRSLILDGRWQEVDTLLAPLSVAVQEAQTNTSINPKKYQVDMNEVGSVDARLPLLAVHKQRLLEMLFGDYQYTSSVQVDDLASQLRRIRMYCDEKEYEQLCVLVTRTDARQLDEYDAWTVEAGRTDCFNSIQPFLGALFPTLSKPSTPVPLDALQGLIKCVAQLHLSQHPESYASQSSVTLSIHTLCQTKPIVSNTMEEELKQPAVSHVSSFSSAPSLLMDTQSPVLSTVASNPTTPNSQVRPPQLNIPDHLPNEDHAPPFEVHDRFRHPMQRRTPKDAYASNVFAPLVSPSSNDTTDLTDNSTFIDASIATPSNSNAKRQQRIDQGQPQEYAPAVHSTSTTRIPCRYRIVASLDGETAFRCAEFDSSGKLFAAGSTRTGVRICAAPQPLLQSSAVNAEHRPIATLFECTDALPLRSIYSCQWINHGRSLVVSGRGGARVLPLPSDILQHLDDWAGKALSIEPEHAVTNALTQTCAVSELAYLDLPNDSPRELSRVVKAKRHTSQVCTGSKSGAIRVWDMNHSNDSGPLITLNDHRDDVFDLCFAISQCDLFSASQDGTVRGWDIRSKGACVLTGCALDSKMTSALPRIAVFSLAYSDTSNYLYGGCDSGMVCCWDARKLSDPIWARTVHNGGRVTVALDGRQLLTAGYDYKLTCLNINAYTPDKPITSFESYESKNKDEGHARQVTSARWQPSSLRDCFLTTCADSRIRLFQRIPGAPLTSTSFTV
jgi:WD40 repeat protein